MNDKKNNKRKLNEDYKAVQVLIKEATKFKDQAEALTSENKLIELIALKNS